jgi:putative adhesin
MPFVYRAIVISLVAATSGVYAANSVPLRQEFLQSYSLPHEGQVVIENLYGDVRIAGWDRDEVRVEAVKSASDARKLETARIVVDSTASVLSIRTEYGPAEADEPVYVAYSIRVPRNANLHHVELVNGTLSIEGISGTVQASSVNGSIKAEKLEGETNLSTINGQLEADFHRVSRSKPILLKSVNGPIVLSIPSGSGAQVVAQNQSGGIRTDFGQSAAVERGHRLETVLHGGGAQIHLVNVNGGISIHSTWSRRPERGSY